MGLERHRSTVEGTLVAGFAVARGYRLVILMLCMCMDRKGAIRIYYHSMFISNVFFSNF